MFTLSYPFRPWRDPKAIVDGPTILQYIRDTAREFGIDRHIRYRHRATVASWDSATARWTVEGEVGGDDTRAVRFTCSFLYACSGYYSYEGGYVPDFPGRDCFTGEMIHPEVAGGPRLRRERRRDHRQRSYRGDPHAGHGGAGGARNHAAAFPFVHRFAARGGSPGPGLPPVPSCQARPPGGPMEKRAVHLWRLLNAAGGPRGRPESSCTP